MPAVAVWLHRLACSAHLQAQLHALIPCARMSGRRDDDGTYVVQMQSCEHPAAPEPAAAVCAWFAPVRCRVEYSGYTLAPLQAQFTSVGPSQETLVTHVLKASPAEVNDHHPSLSAHSVTRREACNFLVCQITSLAPGGWMGSPRDILDP